MVRNSIILYILLCLIINFFFGSLVNATFSDLKVNIFVITSFICSNKYVKQLVLINHSCIPPPHYKGNEDWRSVYSPKNGGGYIFPQKRERLVK